MLLPVLCCFRRLTISVLLHAYLHCVNLFHGTHSIASPDVAALTIRWNRAKLILRAFCSSSASLPCHLSYASQGGLLREARKRVLL